MCRVAPKRFDVVTRRDICQERLKLPAYLGLGYSGTLRIRPPHVLDGVQPDREPKLTEGESVLRGGVQFSACCVIAQALNGRGQQALEETVVRHFAQIHQLRHAIGVDQQATDTERIGTRPLGHLGHEQEISGHLLQIEFSGRAGQGYRPDRCKYTC